MKFLRVLTVFCIACHAVHCLQDRSPGRESAAIEHQYPIIKGDRAPEGIAPYQVSLQTLSKQFICAGSILSRSWILTAAHCLKALRPKDLLILSGSNNLKGKTYHCTDKFMVHSKYDNPSFHNDIALIHLASPLKWNSKTRPIELATQPLTSGSKLLITGWGKTIPFVRGNFNSEFLRMIIVNYVPPKECQKLQNYTPLLDVMGHFCTFSKQAATCFGDSGGPVVTARDKKLVGVVNFVIDPCGSGSPDAHANVMYYRSWIKKNMK